MAGVSFLAKRAAGFAENNMHAEVVNGMNVLAVRDAVRRAPEGCRAGKGPYLIELDTYRYYGHSLSDPRNEYRERDEEASWKKVDPIDTYIAMLVKNKMMTMKQVETLKAHVMKRNAQAAARAVAAADPDPADVIKYMYTDTSADVVPEEYTKVEIIKDATRNQAQCDGELTYRDAIKEALLEEMQAG